MTDKPDMSPLLPDDETLAARGRALEAELRPRSKVSRRASGRIAIAALALVAFGVGGVWAAGVFSARDIAINAGVGCYEQPSLRGNAAIFHSAANPVAKCGRLWREGVLGMQRKTRSKPHLVACTAKDEPVLVFPGPDGLCARLGLEPLPEDYAEIGRAHARAFAALHHVGEMVPATSRCPSPEEAAARARTRLPERYSDVAVAIDGREPCAREYRALGGRIVVRTMSRAVAGQERNGERVSAALLGLFGRLSSHCLPPERVRQAALLHLSSAGVEGATVRVKGNGPCVTSSSWGYDPRSATVDLFAQSRRSWAASR